jgi:mannose-6-phosphate isomerase-like protein (cupin superfamily)
VTHLDHLASSQDARIRSFLSACARRLSALCTTAPTVTGASEFATAVASSRSLQFEPTWLPALDSIQSVDDTPLGRQFAKVAALLPWDQTTRVEDGGADFAFVEFDQVCTLDGASAGLMYIRPGQQYPLHSHAPHEVYLTIAGTAQWRYGGHDGYRSVGPDATVYNHPHDVHSVVAGDTPLVALYVLWH